MKISGFSFAWNVAKLYYPFEEAIRSILPICHEFVIAIGKGDEDDTTREMVEGIGDPKIRIIDTDWSDREKIRKFIHSRETNVALNECTGDWCFYLQADEVVHEDDLPVIEKRCSDLLEDSRVEGLVFDYLHFWGDYNHCHNDHSWYKKEIRIVRNGIGVKSWSSAQSFRLPDDSKLRVAPADARIFHYGWVRPPHLMQKKGKFINRTHLGKEAAAAYYKERPDEFDYGPMSTVPIYGGTHPGIMKKKIAAMDWQDRLREFDPPGTKRELHKHETLKYRALSSFERITGLDFGNKNWRSIVKV